nr:MAG TPA: hypothetical protein [Caudoviricetes sp.]
MHRKNFSLQRRRLNSAEKYFLSGAAKKQAKQIEKVFPFQIREKVFPSLI